MGKDKRGFGERSTDEARIAPKLHKRLHAPLPRRVRSEYIKGNEGGMCAGCVYPRPSLGNFQSIPYRLVQTRAAGPVKYLKKTGF